MVYLKPNVFSKSFSVWEADHECWKCHKPIKVYALGIEDTNHPEKLDQHIDDYFVSNISYLSKDVLEKIFDISKIYFLDASGMAEETYYMNHCIHCCAKQGDWFLHIEPDGPFFGENKRRIVTSYQIPFEASSFF